MANRNLRLAVEGCGHGTLHAIYASIEEACRQKDWTEGPDLVIIGGDFQAVRNADDLTAMSVPQKYREIGDFHEYYSGQRKAPYLTLFVGGNHEASNHLFELYYGGWVAPNIYYLGAANVVRVGPLRIAGLSGIWKGYNYRKPHYERLPYSSDDVKSIYHVRELDVRKLMQLKSQVDIGLSHDWPKGVEWLGDWKQLFRFKPHFEEDAKTGRLGSVAARHVLDRLRPQFWFSAHLHCKYTAIIDHGQGDIEHSVKRDFGHLLQDDASNVNMDEISVDLDEDDDAHESQKEEEVNSRTFNHETKNPINSVSDELRAQLPETFIKPSNDQQSHRDTVPPPAIQNKTTKFLALDKCLPRRRFLQLMEIQTSSSNESSNLDVNTFALSYDPEWLAITRALAPDLRLGDPESRVPPDRDYGPDISEAAAWIDENVIKRNLLNIPEDFERTAPIFDPIRGIHKAERPKEYSNPQTTKYCSLLGIDNPFEISEEERQARTDRFIASGLGQEQPASSFGGRGRGRGRSRDRGSRGNHGARGSRRGFRAY